MSRAAERQKNSDQDSSGFKSTLLALSVHIYLKKGDLQVVDLTKSELLT
jgi:hypothetical protein